MQIMTGLVGVFTWLLVALICISSRTALAQNNASVDPVEARLLNAIFQKLRPSPATEWNISGELCSGAAIDSTGLESFNPAIKCECTYNNNTLCRITALRLYAMDLAGSLPDELWNLTYLTDLNLAQNFFTGPLPAAVSRLTRMQYMTFGINSLSGQLPKELGMLTDLRVLSIGTNNFSGSFPPELGSLTRLEQIYFDSSGISGVIPTSFAGLRSLVTVWGSDTRLTGEIPDFIGNWSRLSVLRLQGNSFQGTIPSSFSNLTSLTDLRISDLSNASYSLEFIRDMTSLSSLVLRNNNVSGSIPSFLGDLKSLQRLDLSFNCYSGGVPDSLFNIGNLTHLFLGNNKLNGTLPQEKSTNLQNIDVSYNELSGSLPSWVNEQNLQLNLVANNFNLSDSSSSSLPSGLNCLQKSFPCNRGFPIYYNFSIKCGGQSLRSTEGILYESDDETLGPATHFTTSSRRWAVSNVGLPADQKNPHYTFASAAQFTNTLNSEIFKSARVSAGSLRYYGLGLENGNYTVNLKFAEPQIRDTISWKSHGRRVFDIYVQGNRVERDFDIKKAAGGRTDSSVERGYIVNVSENHLEVHLFWAGKGTCCVPNQGVYGPLISAISATPDFIPSVSNNPPKLESAGKNNQTGFIVGIVVPIAVVGFLSAFAAYFFIQRRRKRRQMFEDDEFLGMEARPYTFSYAELRAATNEFNPANKLGEGGFGPVFMGKLYDERVVAVKQLSVASHQGKSQFVAEIATISAVQHRNLVKLYGCCIDGKNRLLVYEYLENKSLDQALFGRGSSLHLDWPTRFEICLGVARVLAYLHEESRLRIVHRDVKASNILLDSDLNPKISDFGLAKLYDDKKTHISTGVAGTLGYLAPEYAMRGQLTEKADVFGFGVVALEIVSGRPNSSPKEDRIYLLEWAWDLHENENEIELVDQRLREFEPNEVKRVIDVALLCTQNSPASRPSMSRAVAMLLGDNEIPSVISRPGYLADWQFSDVSSIATTTTTTTTASSNVSASRDDIRYDSSTSIRAIACPSNDTQPILGESLRDGR